MKLENSIASSFQNILIFFEINKEVSNHPWSEYGFVNFEVYIFDEINCLLIYLSLFVFVNNFFELF